jgi:hypothetical protein
VRTLDLTILGEVKCENIGVPSVLVAANSNKSVSLLVKSPAKTGRKMSCHPTLLGVTATSDHVADSRGKQK